MWGDCGNLCLQLLLFFFLMAKLPSVRKTKKLYPIKASTPLWQRYSKPCDCVFRSDKLSDTQTLHELSSPADSRDLNLPRAFNTAKHDQALCGSLRLPSCLRLAPLLVWSEPPLAGSHHSTQLVLFFFFFPSVILKYAPPRPPSHQPPHSPPAPSL